MALKELKTVKITSKGQISIPKLTYKTSESSLAKDWLTEEEDRAWKHL